MCDPGEARTPDLLLRRQSLYPTELLDQRKPWELLSDQGELNVCEKTSSANYNEVFVELASVTYYQIEITHLDSEITVEPYTVVHTLHTFQYGSVSGNLREILYAFYNQHFFALS